MDGDCVQLKVKKWNNERFKSGHVTQLLHLTGSVIWLVKLLLLYYTQNFHILVGLCYLARDQEILLGRTKKSFDDSIEIESCLNYSSSTSRGLKTIHILPTEIERCYSDITFLVISLNLYKNNPNTTIDTKQYKTQSMMQFVL